MRVVAIIQARLGSTRLPGKVLRELGGKTVLAHVIGRVKACTEIDAVVVATPDDDVALEAFRCGAAVFIGSEHDVLDRYYQAAKEYNADAVVRITADCPLLNTDILTMAVRDFRKGSVGYIGNTQMGVFPRGWDVEVFSMEALQKAWLSSKDPYEREHVTPYLYRNFPYAEYGFSWHRPHRLTLDTEDDWNLFRAIEHEVGMNADPFVVTGLLDDRPEIRALNAHVVQKTC